MLDKTLSFIAPHYCCGCDKIGTLLCDNCKYDIKDDAKYGCIACGKLAGPSGVCNTCRVPYERAWTVGARTGILQRLVGNYKFQRTRSAYKVLGDLLLDLLPDLPAETVIIPVPTVASHVRERGYDHMLLIAKYVAKSRGLSVNRPLQRKTNTKQRQSTAKLRSEQAKNAFEVHGRLYESVPYLLIDDVVTTGATIKYAAKTLQDAGAKHIWVAAIARQTLD